MFQGPSAPGNQKKGVKFRSSQVCIHPWQVVIVLERTFALHSRLFLISTAFSDALISLSFIDTPLTSKVHVDFETGMVGGVHDQHSSCSTHFYFVVFFILSLSLPLPHGIKMKKSIKPQRDSIDLAMKIIWHSECDEILISSIEATMLQTPFKKSWAHHVIWLQKYTLGENGYIDKNQQDSLC